MSRFRYPGRCGRRRHRRSRSGSSSTECSSPSTIRVISPTVTLTVSTTPPWWGWLGFLTAAPASSARPRWRPGRCRQHEPGLTAVRPGPQGVMAFGGHHADALLGAPLHQGGDREAEGVGQPDQRGEVRVARRPLQRDQGALADAGTSAEFVQGQPGAGAGRPDVVRERPAGLPRSRPSVNLLGGVDPSNAPPDRRWTPSVGWLYGLVVPLKEEGCSVPRDRSAVWPWAAPSPTDAPTSSAASAPARPMSCAR